MKQYIFKAAAFALFATTIFTSCGDDGTEKPKPIEQELITTVKLHVTGANFDKTFSYKVENGFNTGSGTITKDDIVLEANKEYNVSLMLLNEKENPAEDITSEVVSESNDHLFLWQSNPSSGAGSIAVEQGNKDAAGNPFNQTVVFKTAAAGNGEMTITLKHEPTDKNAATPDAAGGETDVEATFPVKVQ